MGISLSTRGIDEEFLPGGGAGEGSGDEIRTSKFAFGSGKGCGFVTQLGPTSLDIPVEKHGLCFNRLKEC